jgi:hypothetical protein
VVVENRPLAGLSMVTKKSWTFRSFIRWSPSLEKTRFSTVDSPTAARISSRA